MRSDQRSRSHEKKTLKIVHEHFMTVASEAERALAALAKHQDAEQTIERIQRLKRTAEEGAALVEARLSAIP